MKSLMAKKKAFPGYPPRCIRIMAFSLAAGMVYPAAIVLAAFTPLEIPYSAAAIYWGLVKLTLVYPIMCLYQAQKKGKIAFVGMLMFTSGVFSFLPTDPFLVYTTEALAITGLSLILFDFGKTFPASKMEVAGGLIFLGVIASILTTETTALVGLLLLLVGLWMASRRLSAAY